MFTGLINHCGTVKECARNERGMLLWIQTKFDDLQVGESIAVDGICLTVVEHAQGGFRCDLSPETLNVTTAENFIQGSTVNLERSLSPSDKLGGHFVYGHVDQVCDVSDVTHIDDFAKITFSGIKETDKHLLVKKGSVSVNGVSLTINNINDNSFDIMLIPETLKRTNLDALKAGNKVNIEYDYLAKLVVNSIQQLKGNS